MAAVFPQTPATVSLAGEDPTVPVVSLGSLGARGSLGCGLGWGGACCVHAGYFVLAWGSPGECGPQGRGILQFMW